jgi:hypothetical protein
MFRPNLRSVRWFALLLWIALLHGATSARAEQTCYTFPGPPAGPQWDLTIQVPAFSTSQGVLTAVEVTVSGSIAGQLQLESLEPQPVTFASEFSSNFTVARSGVLIVGSMPAQSFTDSLAAFDGVVDYGGPSGVTHSNLFLTANGQATLVSPADLAAFTGPPGTTIPLLFSAHDASHVQGTNSYSFQEAQADAGTVTVCYDFTRTMTPFCFGDGTGAACPCANTGTTGHGCQNSAATGGAILEATGAPSLSSDTTLLTSRFELPSALSIFLQGNADLPAPVTYGDGLRCVGGALKRLYSKNASSGTVAAPTGSEPSVSARSAALGDAIGAGQTRSYQVYYRDPNPAFCPAPPGSTFNVSSGTRILWGP